VLQSFKVLQTKKSTLDQTNNLQPRVVVASRMAQKPETVPTSHREEADGTGFDTSAAQKGKKRRRTRSHNSSPSPGRGFFVPGFKDGEGALKMMSLSDFVDAAKGVSNMFLAHEIAMDKDFSVESYRKKQSEQGAEVRLVVHQAFWDIMKAELDEDPPVYRMTFSFLEEIRDGLIKMLLPHQSRIKAEIEEKLDIDLIRQQANNRTLDVSAYSGYLLDLMAKLCAPVRDDEIAILRTKTDVIPLFQGIRVTLENMELDMANYVFEQMRPYIVTHSVKYERNMFSEFLKTQVDGLMLTREWLKRHTPTEEECRDPMDRKQLINRVMTDAYVELLEWDDYFEIPETLAMDFKRIVALRDAVERMSVSTAVVALAFSNLCTYVSLDGSLDFRVYLKGKIDVFFENFFEDADLITILPSVALQIIKETNDYLTSKNKANLPESVVEKLKDLIPDLEDPNHRIREIVHQRIIEFSKEAINPSRSGDIQITPGLRFCQKELGEVVNDFVRLVSYNRSVFGEYYVDIIENHVLSKESNLTRTSEDPK